MAIYKGKDNKDNKGNRGNVVKRKRNEVNSPSTSSTSKVRRINKENNIIKHNPNWEDRRIINKLYSNLIDGNNVNDDKYDIVDNILKQVKNKGINNYILNHSGSRVIQACMKYGNNNQRKSIITLLNVNNKDGDNGGGIKDAILQGKAYGMLAIERLIIYGLKTDRKLTIDILIKPLLNDRNNVERLFIHRIGCRFLSNMYNNTKIPTQYRRRIFHIISTPPSFDITSSNNNDDNKLLEHRMKLCHKCVDKELIDNGPLVHKLFLSTLEIADKLDKSDDIIKQLLQITNEGATRLLSSKEGAMVFSRLFGYASAKEKKVLIKECKGNYIALSNNAVDSIVIIRMLQCTDDTVLLSKTILHELISDDDNINNMIMDQYGHLVLLYCMGERRERFYPQYYREIINLPKPLSMKDDKIRTKEIRNKVITRIKNNIINDNTNNKVYSLYDMACNRYGSVILLYLCCSMGKYDNDCSVTEYILNNILQHNNNKGEDRRGESNNNINNDDICGELVSFILVLILKSDCDLVKDITCDIIKEYVNKYDIAYLSTTRWAFILKAILNTNNKHKYQWIIDKVNNEGGGIENIVNAVNKSENDDNIKCNNAGKALIDTINKIMMMNNNEDDKDDNNITNITNTNDDVDDIDDDSEAGLATDDDDDDDDNNNNKDEDEVME